VAPCLLASPGRVSGEPEQDAKDYESGKEYRSHSSRTRGFCGSSRPKPCRSGSANRNSAAEPSDLPRRFRTVGPLILGALLKERSQDDRFTTTV
jgi:hypothetical protein